MIPIVALNRGPRRAWPRVVIEREQPADIALIAEAPQKLVPLGLDVRRDEVRAMLGFEAPGSDDDVLAPPGARPDAEDAEDAGDAPPRGLDTAAAHALAFRERLVATLQRRRGAGEVEAEVQPSVLVPGDRDAADTVRDAARLFPRRWIEKANETMLFVARNDPERGTQGGLYRPTSPPLARISDDINVAVHEYTHHLQTAMPALDDLFHQLHRARTAGDPVAKLRDYPDYTGRDDQYIDGYFGREYPGEGPLEVITRTYEFLFTPFYGRERLGDMLKDDPGLADLAIGALMRYDP